MTNEYARLKGLYGNVAKYEQTKNKGLKTQVDAFWREFDKIKANDPQKAKQWLGSLQKHFQTKVECKSTVTKDIVRSIETKQSFGWKRARYLAFLLYGNTCACCGLQAPYAQITIDHIKPRSKFPELATDLRNLQPLCHDCNVAKCSWNMTDWRTNEQKFKAIHIMHFPQAIHHYIKDYPNAA